MFRGLAPPGTREAQLGRPVERLPRPCDRNAADRCERVLWYPSDVTVAEGARIVTELERGELARLCRESVEKSSRRSRNLRWNVMS